MEKNFVNFDMRLLKGGDTMKFILNFHDEDNWQDINTANCDEDSLFDMCSWGEAN